MFILAIDTTTTSGSVAVLKDENISVEKSYQIRSGHAEGLLSAVDLALKSAKLEINNIDLFAVAIGPGSFTGLRVGLATAKGLALGTNKPLIGVSSLEALAFTVVAKLALPESGRASSATTLTSVVAKLALPELRTIPCIDAHRNEVYASVNGHEASFTPELLCEELLKHEGKYLFTGDGAARYKEIFSKALGDSFKCASDSANIPLAASVGKLAFAKFNKGQTSDLAGLTPNYIRKPDAELKKDKSSLKC